MLQQKLKFNPQWACMTASFSFDTPCQLHIITEQDVNTDVESEHTNNSQNSLYSASSLQQNARYHEWSTRSFAEPLEISSIANPPLFFPLKL